MKKYKLLFVLAFVMVAILPFKVDAMGIVIRHPERTDTRIEVETSDTIEAVKSKIQEYTGFPADKQILMYNSIKLKDGRTLADYGIQDSSPIDIELIKTKVILDANGGKFTDSEQYIINDYFTEEFIEPTREGYTFKGWYTEKVGGKIIGYYLEENQIEDNMTFYAHWDKKGIVTIDFTTFVHANNWTDLEAEALNIVFDKGLVVTVDDKLFNKDDKLLMTYEEGQIKIADDLSSSDNIVYTLTEEDKESIRVSNNKITSIPNVVEVIFVKEIGYKVTFDANGGKFGNENIYTLDNWDASLYDSLTKPTRDGYKFKGYYTEKTGGTKFEMILNESGIDSDMTFYAQWELEEEVPKTLDNITSSIMIGTISLIGLVSATIYLRKRNKARA